MTDTHMMVLIIKHTIYTAGYSFHITFDYIIIIIINNKLK